MDPFRLLMAVLLLTGPGADFEAPEAAAPHANCAAALRLLALHLEILDPLETHVLAHPQEFAADLRVLRGRYQEFAAAPQLHECFRLPERALVEDLLVFNRSLQKDLKDRLFLDRIHAADLQTALEETEQLFQVWDAVREARCEYYYVTARRQALQQLRNLIGMDAFYTGQLPPHVPLWRIPEY
jgi:hypothetical protein